MVLTDCTDSSCHLYVRFGHAMAPLSRSEATRAKIVEYEKRVTERLQPDLRKAMDDRKALMQERQDYVDLDSNVQRMLVEVSLSL